MTLKGPWTLRAHIRNRALTIPLTDEMREKLDVHEGEELEAHVFEDSLTIFRVSAEARQRAGKRLNEILSRVRLRSGEEPMSEDEIVEMVHDVRRARRARLK